MGVTALCFIRNRVVVARLDGTLDFLEVETFHNPIMSGSPHKGMVVVRFIKNNSSYTFYMDYLFKTVMITLVYLCVEKVDLYRISLNQIWFKKSSGVYMEIVLLTDIHINPKMFTDC